MAKFRFKITDKDDDKKVLMHGIMEAKDMAEVRANIAEGYCMLGINVHVSKVKEYAPDAIED